MPAGHDEPHAGHALRDEARGVIENVEALVGGEPSEEQHRGYRDIRRLRRPFPKNIVDAQMGYLYRRWRDSMPYGEVFAERSVIQHEPACLWVGEPSRQALAPVPFAAVRLGIVDRDDDPQPPHP